jgi:hypothetical protein
MNNEYYNFKNAAPLDISDVRAKIERSFHITLDNQSLVNATTFRSLCDLIASKINQDHAESCTTQHAFYQLRNTISGTYGIDKCSITPHTRLSGIFPRENRLQMIGDIEQELGFETNLLQPKKWVISLFVVMLLASFIGFFYNWQIAAAGCLASVLGLKLAGKFGKEIHLKTIGDLANKICRESRNAGMVNKNEIERKVRDLFENDLRLQPIAIRRKTSFN